MKISDMLKKNRGHGCNNCRFFEEGDGFKNWCHCSNMRQELYGRFERLCPYWEAKEER